MLDASIKPSSIVRYLDDFVIGQDRIGVELLADFVDELEPGQLQEPNGLLQLRRHDQLLAELDLLLDFHC